MHFEQAVRATNSDLLTLEIPYGRGSKKGFDGVYHTLMSFGTR